MSVNSKMSQIAGQIRILTQDHTMMGLDDMAQQLGESNSSMFDAYLKIQNKGGTLPDVQSMANLPSAVDTIPTGVELNFEVIGSLTEPTDPKENTIWIKTGVPVTSYVFSPNQPENAVEGMAWIATGTSSPVEFNALKENCIQVNPVSAKIYYSGAWVSWDAVSYQNGEWVDWYIWDGGLFSIGDEYMPVTGGWTTVAEGTDCSMIIDANGLTINANSYNGITAFTRNKIDLTGFSTVYASVVKTGGGSGSTTYNCFLRLHDSLNVMDIEVYVSSVQIPQGTSNKVFSLPVPVGGGRYYVSLVLYGVDDISAVFDRVWLE